MKRFPIILVIGGLVVIAGRHLVTHGGRRPIDFAAVRRRMMKRMMASMPDDSPPKLIVSVLPRLREQSDQILALLKEQNELLRQRKPNS